MNRANIKVIAHHRRDEAWDLNWIKFLPYRFKKKNYWKKENRIEFKQLYYTWDDKPHAEARGSDGDNE